eukprot:scaffold1912_cov167-Amphora_coffeaeformis.AAC.40
MAARTEIPVCGKVSGISLTSFDSVGNDKKIRQQSAERLIRRGSDWFRELYLARASPRILRNAYRSNTGLEMSNCCMLRDVGENVVRSRGVNRISLVTSCVGSCRMTLLRVAGANAVAVPQSRTHNREPVFFMVDQKYGVMGRMRQQGAV